jgi:ABC-2 type transport system ATP-binding protein
MGWPEEGAEVSPGNEQYPIETSALGRRFGRKQAVHDLNIRVPEGRVFALIGPNGAGKTTTIKMLMDIIEPSAGSARVLGKDTRKLGPAEFRRIGYVSENQKLPEWMTVAQFLAYCKPMYQAWDESFSERLLDLFILPRDGKIRNLSRGMKVQAALISSLAYRPALLVLDEPFSGLDPVVREDLTKGVLELTEDAKWTVLISSQDIEEVERLADWVAFLDEGRLVFSESVQSLQSRFRQIEVVITDGTLPLAGLPSGWMLPEVAGHMVRFVDSAYTDRSEEQVRSIFPGCREVRSSLISLREIFIVLTRSGRAKNRGAHV